MDDPAQASFPVLVVGLLNCLTIVVLDQAVDTYVLIIDTQLEYKECSIAGSGAVLSREFSGKLLRAVLKGDGASSHLLNTVPGS
ncbi:hypothetical protein D3C78_1556270 [compost metagenome]